MKDRVFPNHFVVINIPTEPNDGKPSFRKKGNERETEKDPLPPKIKCTSRNPKTHIRTLAPQPNYRVLVVGNRGLDGGLSTLTSDVYA